MDILAVPMSVREKLGSAEARRVRRAGRLPGVLYGLDRPPVPLSVDTDEFQKSFVGGSRVFDLKLEGKQQLCLLKDIQYAVDGGLLHVDFARIDEHQTVTITVALTYIGEPESVAHAFVEYPRQDVEVTCMPRAIPAGIEVPVTGLPVGSHIEAGQLELPEGVELASSPKDVVVTYHFRHAGMEEDLVEGEESGTAEPEVLTERKPEEEQ